MIADKVIWIGEPSEENKKFKAKHGYWNPDTTWPCVFKFNDGTTMKSLMGEQEHDIYLAEKSLLEHPIVKHLAFNPQTYRELLNLIEKYGDAREQKGRHDVQEDWAEQDAGAGV